MDSEMQNIWLLYVTPLPSICDTKDFLGYKGPCVPCRPHFIFDFSYALPLSESPHRIRHLLPESRSICKRGSIPCSRSLSVLYISAEATRPRYSTTLPHHTSLTHYDNASIIRFYSYLSLFTFHYIMYGHIPFSLHHVYPETS